MSDVTPKEIVEYTLNLLGSYKGRELSQDVSDEIFEDVDELIKLVAFINYYKSI